MNRPSPTSSLQIFHDTSAREARFSLGRGGLAVSCSVCHIDTPVLCLQYYTEETVYEEVPGEVRLGPHMHGLVLITEEPLSLSYSGSQKDAGSEDVLGSSLACLCPEAGGKRPNPTFDRLIHCFYVLLIQDGMEWFPAVHVAFFV